jgi:poly(hydroxyalkanoate) depolymerase family esterase
MKLPSFTKMRAAAQNLLHKGAQPAPAMRDINPPPAPPPSPPPAHASAAQARMPSAAAPEPTPAAAPNPATHPAEYAQDMLSRMGIKVDLQANIDSFGAAMKPGQYGVPGGFEMPKFDMGGFDFSSLDIAGFKAPSDGKPALPEGAQFISGSYRNHAGSRNYKLYIPSSYRGQAMPLLVMLHGCTQDPDDFAAGTQMNLVAEEKQCFVVYPEQTMGANHSKCWNWFNAIDQQRGQGEPSIIAGIAQQIIDEYPVSESQVYVAGLSAGGAMAVIVGTLYPDLFAAVGVHSGLPFASAQDLPSALNAMKRGASNPRKAGDGALPIIVFHGDQDHTVHPLNGEQVMEQGLHGQNGKARPSVQSGSVPNGHRYTQTTHHKADGTPAGEHWVVHGAGHAWSGGSTQGTYTDGKGPDASREMVRFFSTVS